MPKKQTDFYQIINQSAESKSVDILLYGTIPSFDEDRWEMKNTCDKFLREFRNLEANYDRINLHINSPGGSLYHAFPIFNALISSKKDIHTYNDGIAASAGGVLLLAGKTVHSAKNGMLMIHNALNMIYGNAQDMRECAEVLDKYDKVLAQHFADKSGKTMPEIMASYFSYKDKWLTAEEAKAEGFIDVIEDYESEDAPPSDIANMALSEVMAHYQKPEKQEGLLAKITNHVREALNLSPKADPVETPVAPVAAIIPLITTPVSTTNQPDMDFKNSLAVLDKPNPTAEEMATVKAEISAFVGAKERFTAEEVSNQIAAVRQPLEDQVSNLSTEKDNLQAQVISITDAKKVAEEENTALDTENKGLKLDIQAYRASGVAPTNSHAANGKPDGIAGDVKVEDFYSEADQEIANLRKEMGMETPATK